MKFMDFLNEVGKSIARIIEQQTKENERKIRKVEKNLSKLEKNGVTINQEKLEKFNEFKEKNENNKELICDLKNKF